MVMMMHGVRAWKRQAKHFVAVCKQTMIAGSQDIAAESICSAGATATVTSSPAACLRRFAFSPAQPFQLGTPCWTSRLVGISFPNGASRHYATAHFRKRGNREERNVAAAPLRNDEIIAEEVRLVFPEEEERATVVVPLSEAREEAELRKLDLVMVSEAARPPVVRIALFDKVLYEMRKKAKITAKQQREQQKLVDPKEVRIGSKSADHDRQLKFDKAKEFLETGQHLRLAVTFKGMREAAESRAVMVDILDGLQGLAYLKDVKHLTRPARNQWVVQLAPTTGKSTDGDLTSQLERANDGYAKAQAERAAEFRAAQQLQRQQQQNSGMPRGPRRR